MEENTLFPDSETLDNKRPKVITEKQNEEFLQEVASEIIEDGYSISDKSYIIEDLRHINLNDTGFEIAKDIEEGKAYYKIDSNFIEFLEDLSWKKSTILENNVKAWVKAHNQ